MSHVALVTGASSGIGETFARKLSRLGYRLILVARRKERLEKLAAELRDADALPADLTVDSELRSVEHRIAAEPDLEFLVNNAGFGLWGSFYELSLDDQERMHRLHIIAIERLTHAALRGMVKHRIGNIINVSSVAGFHTIPFNVSYCATKAWINSFTEGIYLELRAAQSPVRVQALCPGFTYSEFHRTVPAVGSGFWRFLWMSAEDVVDVSLRGLKHNKPIVIPGWYYRLFIGIHPWIPRPLKHALSISYAGSRRKSRSTPNT
jgi:hypothetical protein